MGRKSAADKARESGFDYLNELRGSYTGLRTGNQAPQQPLPPVRRAIGGRGPASGGNSPYIGGGYAGQPALGSSSPPSGGTNGPPGGGQWTKESFTKIFGTPNTPAELEALEPKLKEYGITIARNAKGTAGKIQLPEKNALGNNIIVDVVRGAEGGGKGFWWDDQKGGHGRAVGMEGQQPNMSAPGVGGNNYQPGGPGTSGGYVGGLHDAIAGYGDFARTGGFSPQDIQSIRERANAPIRSMYSQGKAELDRAKNISGGYMPNFAAAQAKMNREGSYQMGQQSMGTEAMLAEAKRTGRLSGMQGLGQLGLGLGGQEIDIARTGANLPYKQGFDWAKLIGAGVTGAAMLSDKNSKENITPIKSKGILRKLKKMPISEWNYKDDPSKKKHIGPMAQDFKKLTGKGDGKTIDVIDAVGVTLAASKALAEKYA